MLQLGDLIITAPSGLREQLAAERRSRGKAALCARLRPTTAQLQNPTQRCEVRTAQPRTPYRDSRLARSPSSTQLALVATAAPRTTALLGISTGHAGQLLLTAGQNINRLHGESSFAALCGASPIPAPQARRPATASTYGGDRQANRALHMIAVCRLRYCPAHPRLRHSDAPAKARPSARSSAASSATSPARSTPPYAPTSKPSPPPLDIYRNVSGWLTRRGLHRLGCDRACYVDVDQLAVVASRPASALK